MSNKSDELILFIARAGGLGSLPKMPGTFGSLPGLLIWYCTTLIDNQGLMLFSQIGLILLLIFVGVWISGRAETILNKVDPGEIVIDETVGMLIAVVAVPFNIVNLVLAFILFRIFDIFKPYPISKIQDLHAGWGIMLDDILAGLAALLLMHIYLFVF